MSPREIQVFIDIYNKYNVILSNKYLPLDVYKKVKETQQKIEKILKNNGISIKSGK
ncbi:MAG: hypothetical protein N3B21_00960 [Clostridia bacterium]|nr:hypothetical protein [Clostridia bacterium]